MSQKHKIILSHEEVENAIKNSCTMGAAAQFLKIDWRTFKQEAERHGLYRPVKQSRKRFNLSDILEGKHSQYPTSKILPRLIAEGYKTYKCDACHISEWNGMKISLEIDHIDGNNGNHQLVNLRVLCPNCHSQTPTYRSKKLTYKN